MSVESDIFDALKGLVGNRCFPDVAPVGTARPYITYQQIGGRAVGFLENALPSKKHGTFQINAWSETRAGAAALSRQIETALVAIGARPTGDPAADYEDDTRLYGTLQDFSIWSDR